MKSKIEKEYEDFFKKDVKDPLDSIVFMIFLLFFAVIGCITVGQMDYEDAVASETHYANMVCSGSWPDFKELKPKCKNIPKK